MSIFFKPLIYREPAPILNRKLAKVLVKDVSSTRSTLSGRIGFLKDDFFHMVGKLIILHLNI